MEIYLIRHTTPLIKEGICYGRSDIQLADTFRKEAEKLQSELPGTIDILYSSPSYRCYQLAKLLRARKKKGDERLLELDFGDWEMKAWNKIDKSILDVWMKHFVSMRVPNGESYMDLHHRVCDFFQELLMKKYRQVAIVTHAGVIRCILAKFLKIPATDIFSINPDYASVNRLHLNPDGSFDTDLL